jgi:hypothetical protein
MNEWMKGWGARETGRRTNGQKTNKISTQLREKLVAMIVKLFVPGIELLELEEPINAKTSRPTPAREEGTD